MTDKETVDTPPNITRVVGSDFSYTDSLVASRTAVLFSTNRGIYLRAYDAVNRTSSGQSPNGNQKYLYRFCDLERWQCTGGLSRVDSIGLTPSTTPQPPPEAKGVSNIKRVRFVREHGESSTESSCSVRY